jgi:uracil-DNA glycosylase
LWVGLNRFTIDVNKIRDDPVEVFIISTQDPPVDEVELAHVQWLVERINDDEGYTRIAKLMGKVAHDGSMVTVDDYYNEDDLKVEVDSDILEPITFFDIMDNGEEVEIDYNDYDVVDNEVEEVEEVEVADNEVEVADNEVEEVVNEVEEVEVDDISLNTYDNCNLAEFTEYYAPRNGWEDFFTQELLETVITPLSEKLQNDYTQGQIYPPLHKIYNAFYSTALNDVKVIVIGQDPYHGPDQATGIAFAVGENSADPPSLVNIYKEMKSEGIKISTKPSFEKLAKRGVLLINTALTVLQATPDSHSDIWGVEFTPRLMNFLNENCGPVVLLLLGNHAKKYSKYFDDNKHKKVITVHPPPLSASRGFFGSKPFGKVNAMLKLLGHQPVDWSL